MSGVSAVGTTKALEWGNVTLVQTDCPECDDTHLRAHSQARLLRFVCFCQTGLNVILFGIMKISFSHAKKSFEV